MALTAQEFAKLKTIQTAGLKKEQDALEDQYFGTVFWDSMKRNFQGITAFFFMGTLHGLVIGAAFGALLCAAAPVIGGIFAATITSLGLLGTMGASALACGIIGGAFGMDIGSKLGIASGAVSAAMAKKETHEKILGMEAATEQALAKLTPAQESALKEKLATTELPKPEKDKVFFWKNGVLWSGLAGGFGALGAIGSLMALNPGRLAFGKLMSSTLLNSTGGALTNGAVGHILGGAALGLTGLQVVALSAGVFALTGFTFGTSRSVYKRILAATDHLVEGTVKGVMSSLLGKDTQEPTKENNMQKKSILGGIVRFAILGAVIAGALTFGAAALPAAFFLHGIASAIGAYASFGTMGIAAGIFGLLGGVRTAAQNAAVSHEEAAYAAPVYPAARTPAASVQISMPAPVQDAGKAQHASTSFAAREDARAQEPPAPRMP